MEKGDQESTEASEVLPLYLVETAGDDETSSEVPPQIQVEYIDIDQSTTQLNAQPQPIQSESCVSLHDEKEAHGSLSSEHHGVSFQVGAPLLGQYQPAGTTFSDTTQLYSAVNGLPSLLLSPSPAQDKDSALGISATVLDKLRSILLPTASTSLTGSTLPLYTLANNQGVPTVSNNELMPVTSTAPSPIQASLPVVHVAGMCPSITILTPDGGSKVSERPDVNVSTSTSVIPSLDPSTTTNTSSPPKEQVVELLMEVDNTQKPEGQHYELIEVAPTETPSTYTYCVDCNQTFVNGCNQHDTMYRHVPDSVHLSRARATIPKCIYLMDVVAAHTSITGVFAKEDIPAKSLFGPIEGRLETPDKSEQSVSKNGNIWKVYQDGQATMSYDCSCEESSNWLMFMQRAGSNAAQNVVVYQQEAALYFVTTREVKQGEQLMYWYSADYAELLGLSRRPDLLTYCNICHEQFVSPQAVEGHKRQLHPPANVKRRFCCPVCQKAFTSRHKVDIHMSKHTKLKPAVCAQCGKGFTDKSNLRKHLKIHTDEKNFRCLYCGNRFRQKAHLDAHIVMHTGEKRLACEYCGKQFSRPGDLKQHSYMHTGERHFPCSICSKTFHRKQNLSKHLRLHRPDRVRLPCDKCTKDFPDKYHRDRHRATCRGVKPPSQIRSETGAELGLSIAKRRIQKRDTQNQLKLSKAQSS